MNTQKLPKYALVTSLLVAVFSMLVLMGGKALGLYPIGTTLIYFLFGIQVIAFMFVGISFVKWGKVQGKK